MVKEAAEIEAIRRAAALVDLALAVVVAEGLVGRTERDVAWRLREEFRDRGAEDESFPTIVAAGDHGAHGHAIPGERRIKAGELVVIDSGARVDGYCSDITRTFAAGRVDEGAPPPLRRRARGAARRARRRAPRRPRPRRRRRGRPRRHRRRPATASASVTAPGTASGSRSTRRPAWAACRGDRLAAGMVCTVEPGIYLEGDAGVRIEDTVLVTADGCERLTLYPKELQVVDLRYHVPFTRAGTIRGRTRATHG